MKDTEFHQEKCPDISSEPTNEDSKERRPGLLRSLQGEEESTSIEIVADGKSETRQVASQKETARQETNTAVLNRKFFEQLIRNRNQASSIQDDIGISQRNHISSTRNISAKDDILLEEIKRKDRRSGFEEILGYKFLKEVGLIKDGSLSTEDKNEENSCELQKEVVTHNGSCGANSIAISFFIQVLEEQIQPQDSDYTKLIVSWNTTYPMKKVANATEVFALLKKEFQGGNTKDMEDILGPVIRVYIGISQKIMHEESPRLSEDTQRQWSQEALNGIDLDQIRESVGEICKEDEQNEELEETQRICSHKYYLDESDLEVISSELFNCRKVRASQVQMNIEQYKEIDRKLKANEALIRKWEEENGQEVEINSKIQAHPNAIEASYRKKNISVECYNVDMNSPAYAKWVEFQSLVQIEYTSIERSFDRSQDSIESVSHLKTKEACTKICEKRVRRHIEEKLLAQVENGNGLITPQWNCQDAEQKRPSIYIAHSNFIFWDVLISKEAFQKYSREHRNKQREYVLNPKQLEYLNYKEDITIRPDFFGDATPYINLESEQRYAVYVENCREEYSESKNISASIASLIRGIMANLSVERIIYAAAFTVTCFMTSILTACIITLSIILANAYFSENKDCEISREESKINESYHSSNWNQEGASEKKMNQEHLRQRKTESFHSQEQNNQVNLFTHGIKA